MDEHQIQHGQQWLAELLQLSGLPVQVHADGSKFLSEGSCWLTIDDRDLTSEQVQVLTGADGIVLDAIQYLANTTLNLGQPEELQAAYTVELAGYRVRRQAELQKLAEEAAEHVRETGEEYEMASLSAAERRQVHTYLKTFDDLETYSRGKEPDRRLVIRLLQT
ncbi:MAG: RNA-binding protein [Cyanobacteria bacterium CRU_2_1]|nr:RNA-binding protein [Cyanobacteria bacterium RU_5_0]NJR57539.1 RNA-binding protein [Cyanobacteria bacterium CRU_2_1]